MLVAATKTPFSSTELLGALRHAWRLQVIGEPTQASICVLCAQVALETANGKSCVQWNVGNFKRPDPAAGDYCCFATTEWIGDKEILVQPPDPGSRFAAFASLADGCDYYLSHLRSHWTAAWPSVVIGDPVGFAQGLHDQKPFPYYTAPVAQYAAGVKRWFDSYVTLPWVPEAPPTTLDAIVDDVEGNGDDNPYDK